MTAESHTDWRSFLDLKQNPMEKMSASLAKNRVYIKESPGTSCRVA
ncbi:hypothetical protein DDI_2718 [Dickeya dianthicola RNS04.9]|nr:hypothetical protein DDI_2718 [Dickeya dianthicola RNS04.9]